MLLIKAELVLFTFLDGYWRRGARGRGGDLIRDADAGWQAELGRHRIGGNDDEFAKIVVHKHLISRGIGCAELRRANEGGCAGEHRTDGTVKPKCCPGSQ